MCVENRHLNALMASLKAATVTVLAAGIFVTLLMQTSTRAQQAQTPQTTAPQIQKALPADTAFSASQKKSIEQIVREYLIQNPEILIEMSSALERRQAEAQQQSFKKVIAENAEAIFRGQIGIVAGNPKGDVTVVEFFDYNCPYCKSALSTLSKLIETDGKIRLVLMELPIFGERSIGAARVAIAAKEQGKYFEFHSELLKLRGQATEVTALRVAKRLGLDIKRLKQDMARTEVETILNGTNKLADILSIQATPFFLVGDRAIPGAPDNLYDLLVQKVAEVRKEGCPVPC
jgi:protein-disulfide isomerase